MRAGDWDARYAEGGLVWGAAPNRFLVAEVEGLTPGRALDLACGEGRNALWLVEEGWRVTGVDYSAVAIDKARAAARARGLAADFVHADVLEWEPEPLAFELVCVVYLHLPPDERRRVLGAAAGAVAAGGTLLVVGHDLTNLTEGHGGPSDAGVLFTPEQVAAELPGLEVERAERVLREVDGAPRPAIDALVRARRP